MSPEFLSMAGRFFAVLGWVTLPLLLLPFFLLMAPRLLSTFARSLIEIIDGLSHLLGETVKWAALIMVLVIVYEVVALTVFGHSNTKISEIAIYCNVVIVMLGSAATLLSNQHVRVDIFYSKMSPKSKGRVEIYGFYLLLVPVCIIVSLMSLNGVALAWQSLEGSSETDGIRGVYLLRTLIPAFAVLMLMQGLSIAMRGALVLRGLPRPNRPHPVAPLFGNPSLDTES